MQPSTQQVSRREDVLLYQCCIQLPHLRVSGSCTMNDAEALPEWGRATTWYGVTREGLGAAVQPRWEYVTHAVPYPALPWTHRQLRRRSPWW